MIGIIYAIRSSCSPKYYIGSTTLDLKKRFRLHKYQYKRYNDGKFNYITSFEILKYDNCYIEVIEEISFEPTIEGRSHLLMREGEHIKAHKKLPVVHIVNKKIDGRTIADYVTDNAVAIKLYQKKYRTDNREYYKQYMVTWLNNHPGYMMERSSNLLKNKKSLVI